MYRRIKLVDRGAIFTNFCGVKIQSNFCEQLEYFMATLGIRIMQPDASLTSEKLKTSRKF